MIVLGIDPGLTGAYAVIRNGRLVDAGDLPVSGDGTRAMVSGVLFHALIPSMTERVVVERVGAMLGQGVSSMFKFGRTVGVVEGVVTGAGFPLVWVEPQIWKKHFKLIGRDKDDARQLAIETWPDKAGLFARRKDCGRADAALIALWGWRAAVAAGEAA